MSTQPQAHIALNNNRLKSYADVVYLKDNDEFQIELFNPHSQSVLAKIWINDQLISDSGLVLRPGMRYFLDRYIDENRKFKFSTYKVQGDNSEVLEAIKNNGSIKVEFYAEATKTFKAFPIVKINNWEQTSHPTNYPPIGTPYWIDPILPYWINMDRKIYGGPNTTVYGPGTFYCSTNTTNLSNQGTVTCYSTNSAQSFSGTSGVAGASGTSILRSQSLKNEVTMDSMELETGRVEKGGTSKQEFSAIDMDFSVLPITTIEWKILPESQKPVETTEIRNYCSECGTRIKKQSWKFCPNCGTKS